MVDLEEFDSTLYWLDETEVRYITDAVDQEYKQDLRANTLAILLDLLEQEPEPGVRNEVLAILESLLAHLLNSERLPLGGADPPRAPRVLVGRHG